MLFIRFGSHIVLRGFLLSLSGDTIRVALEDCGDAAEYRRVENGWVSEFGDPVEIELQPTPESELCPFPLTPSMERSLSLSCVV
jgi:hypothetical protein